MCSELTPRAHVPDNRIPQLMQPCDSFFKIFHVRLGKKSKSVSFSRVYVCVKAKLTLVSFFYAPSPKQKVKGADVPLKLV